MKPFLRITGRIFGNLLYYVSALLIALVLAVSVFTYLGLHYYNGYYQDYMDVQQSWAKIDNHYVEYINKLDNNLDLINKHIDSINTEETSINTKFLKLQEELKQGIYSMSYNEKFVSYPIVINSSNDLFDSMSYKDNEELVKLKKDLDNIHKSIKSSTSDYNSMANKFNKTNSKFPENIISELGSFHPWEEL